MSRFSSSNTVLLTRVGVSCRYLTVMVWAVNNYLELITVSAASIFIFCYSSMMPHYNNNIDVVASLLVGTMNFSSLIDLDFSKKTPYGCLGANQTDHRLGMPNSRSDDGGNFTNATGSW